MLFFLFFGFSLKVINWLFEEAIYIFYGDNERADEYYRT